IQEKLEKINTFTLFAIYNWRIRTKMTNLTEHLIDSELKLKQTKGNDLIAKKQIQNAFIAGQIENDNHDSMLVEINEEMTFRRFWSDRISSFISVTNEYDVDAVILDDDDDDDEDLMIFSSLWTVESSDC
ncbi:hypothetical protein DERP_008858, partial [Dermatophagoides pteronyssinus]